MEDMHAAVSSFFHGDFLRLDVALDLVEFLVMSNSKVVP